MNRTNTVASLVVLAGVGSSLVAAPPITIEGLFADWSKRFGDKLGLAVTQLTGETAADLKMLERGQVVIATAEQWDVVSRRWKQRKNVQDVALYICDEIGRAHV